MNAPPLSILQEAGDRLPAALAMPEEPVLPLSVEGYHALLQAGILKDGDPVELLEGFLVPKTTREPKHERARRVLRRLLEKLISAEFFVDEQGAITAETSEPEPDIFIIRGSIDQFLDRHASPAEIALVVEIADSSLRRDRTWKKRVYATAGVPQYWIVNLINDCIEVFTQPPGESQQPSYAEPAIFHRGDEVPVVIAGQEVGRLAVAEILGRTT